MARRKIPTTVYIEPEQDQRLKSLSERTNVPVAEYIRKGIDLVLQANQEPESPQLGLFDSPKKQQKLKKDK